MAPFDNPELLDNYDGILGTSDICPKSGYWICKEHPAVKVFVKEHEYFPKCPQRGHNTIWYRIMNRSELTD